MINLNHSPVNSGYFNTASPALSQRHQPANQAFTTGNNALPSDLLQLISQLLQQIIGLKQHQSASRDAHCQGGHHAGNTQGGAQQGRGQGVGRQAVQSAQAFNTPVGANEPGPALNGGAYEFTVAGQPGQNLSFATMLAATNDQFVAPDSRGIPLFDQQGRPQQGDITHLLAVWDAGTEANEPVGSGANQPSNQAGPNTGPSDPKDYVRRSEEGVAPVNQLVNASMKYNNDGTFTVRVENISGENNGTEIPLAPGVATVHRANARPLFSEFRQDRGAGLEALAEDGDPVQLLASLQSRLAKTPHPASG